MTMEAKGGSGGRNILAPTVVDGKDGETIASHPAFAQMAVNRVSGSATLYGSDFRHQGYVSVKILASTLHRRLSGDLLMTSLQPHIEVVMSEAQWSTVVSSMNIGMGTQCTLRRLAGKEMPGLPDPEPRTAHFAGEVDARMKRAVELLGQIEESITTSGLSKAKQHELITKVRMASNDIGVNVNFVAEQFSEHIDAQVQKAGLEINAWAAGVLQQTGLNALAQEQGAPLLLLSDDDSPKG